MDSGLQRYLSAASELTGMTRRTAERVVQLLVQQGELASDTAERYVDELLSRSERNRESLISLVRTETERVVQSLGLVRRTELDRLRARVDALETELTGAAPPPVTPRPARTRKSAAQRRADEAQRTADGAGETSP
ncbi:MAG: phasin family protein [Egibacteraceae bacterium]